MLRLQPFKQLQEKREDDLLWCVSLLANLILLNSVQISQTLPITLSQF